MPTLSLRSVLVLPIFLAACSSNGGSPAADGGSADASPTAPLDAEAPLDGGDDASATLPATPAGQRLAWVIAALNGATVTGADVTANFTASFLANVSAAQIEATFTQLATAAPWTFVRLEGATTPSALVAVVRRGDGQLWRISLETSAADGNKMLILSLAPAGDLDPSLATFDAIDTAARAIAPSVNMLAASVDGAGCTPIHGLNPGSSLAIGSAFKLYVLAALAQSIEAGTRAWTDTIAIQDAHKSLPSGDLQNQPAGTLLPVRTYADKMISISDNTAADHLLFTVGRDAVEAMLGTAKHHDPSRNQPFLGTRELFTLKLLLSPSDQQAYVDAPLAQKRTLLAQYDATLDPRTFTGTWGAPRRIDTLEWFATPADLCNVMATLKSYGDKPATKPVLDVLAINPGIADNAHAFAYVGYKGGSEPGVIALSWLVQRASDQGWRFLSMSFNDTTADVSQDKIVYVASAARALLAK